jgi:hypothetical protein
MYVIFITNSDTLARKHAITGEYSVGRYFADVPTQVALSIRRGGFPESHSRKEVHP